MSSRTQAAELPARWLLRAAGVKQTGQAEGELPPLGAAPQKISRAMSSGNNRLSLLYRDSNVRTTLIIDITSLQGTTVRGMVRVTPKVASAV